MTTLTEEGFLYYKKKLPEDTAIAAKELSEAVKHMAAAREAIMGNALLLSRMGDIRSLIDMAESLRKAVAI